MRRLFAATAVAAALLAASCTAGTARPSASATPLPPDPGRPGPAGPRGALLVHYELGSQQLTDYWSYVHHRWVFDLVLSKPDAVKLYRMTPRHYVAALGCAR